MVFAVNSSRTGTQIGGSLLELDVARQEWSRNRPEFARDPETKFNAKLSTFNGVLEIINNPVPGKLSYKILNDRLSILLQPIVLNNNFNVKFRSIKINLPDRILPNCFVINSFTSEDQTYIITDSITETGLLITTILELSQFVEQPSKANDVSSNNYEEWSQISNPYGFDIRKPQILYSYSFDYSFVLLKDGGIIGLKKDVKNFSFEPVIFNDSSYLESLGHLLKPWAKRPKFNNDSTLSEKAALDVLHFGDLLLTVTINRKLRIWSISTQSLILEKDLTELSSLSSNKPFFDSTPTKFLDLLTIKVGQEDLTYLSLFLPFGEGLFKIFQFQTSPTLDIQDLGKNFEFPTKLAESNALWSIGDFKLSSIADQIELWVLWKSNTSSIIQSLKISPNENTEWVSTYQPVLSIQHKLNTETSTEFYHRKIFQSGLYTNEIIQTALPIFEAHFAKSSGDEDDESILDDLSLVEKVSNTIGRAIQSDNNYDFNLEKQWSRFDTLCQEFKKQADEPLALFIDNELILLSNRIEFSSIRPLSDIETIHYNKSQDDSKDLTKFADTIHQFRLTLGRDVQENIKNSLSRLSGSLNLNESHIKVFGSIYDEHLNKKFNQTNLGTLVAQLSEFDNVFQHIQTLLDLQYTDVVGESLVKSELTSISSQIVIEATREIIQSNSETLLDLAVLLLVLDFDDKEAVSRTTSQILKLYKDYQIVQTSFFINFNPSTKKLELDNVSQISNSLFQSIISLRFPNGFQFTNINLIKFIQGSILPFIHSEEFFQTLIVWLISNDYSSIAYQNFIEYLIQTPVHQLLKAVVYFKTNQASKSSKIFISKSAFISQYRLSVKEKETLKPLDDFIIFFHTNLSKYYLNLSILFLNHLQLAEALKFIENSINNKSNAEFDSKFDELKYHTYLTVAIELSDFEKAAVALKRIDDPKLKEECLNKFIYQLYKTSSVKSLNDFEFGKDELKIDELLSKKAQNAKGYQKALYFYKVLYSYRLKNKNFRGSVEALYEFINSYRELEDIRFIIADLYIVILNLVSTFDKDDQWLTYKLNDTENDVLNHEELKEQFNNLVGNFSKLDRSKYELF